MTFLNRIGAAGFCVIFAFGGSGILFADSPGEQTERVSNRKPKKQGYHDIVKKAAKSVVTVRTNTSSGSGFVIRPDGYILTNHHVIADATQIDVLFNDWRHFGARLIGSDSDSDVALLKIAAREIEVSKLGNSAELEPGEVVLAIGSPKGLLHTVTAGIVSALGRSEMLPGGPTYRNFIQTDAPINSGNSGGPLINSLGEVVGINTLKWSVVDVEGFGFAIPINQALSLSDQLIETGEIRRGRIGVVIEELTFRNRVGLRIPEGIYGVHVLEIEQGGPSDEAGLEMDDIIVRFNGDPVRSMGALQAAASCLPPGKEVKVTVIRGPKTLELPLTLGGNEEEEIEEKNEEKEE